MKLKSIDLTKILKEQHENKWVALSRDYTKVMGVNSKLKDLKEKIGDEDVVYMKVPSSDRIYAY